MRAALHALLAELHFAGMRETLDTVLDAAERVLSARLHEFRARVR
jgi:hypothetical protein